MLAYYYTKNIFQGPFDTNGQDGPPNVLDVTAAASALTMSNTKLEHHETATAEAGSGSSTSLQLGPSATTPVLPGNIPVTDSVVDGQADIRADEICSSCHGLSTLSPSPFVLERSCTDVIWCVMFAVFLIGMFAISVWAFIRGNPGNILLPKPMDFVRFGCLVSSQRGCL